MGRQAIRCKAKLENGPRKGERCTKWAMEGQLVCYYHGGNSPQAKAAAAVRIAEKRARSELARLDVKPVGNALEELARVSGQVVAWKDVCASMVNNLGEDLRYATAGQGEQIRAEITLWERSLDRCIAALSAMARLGLDERLVVIEEGKAALIARAFEEALTEVPGLEPEHIDVVRHSFGRKLRALPRGMSA